MGIERTTYDYIVGVDTHARKHVWVLMNNLGVISATGEMRVLSRGFAYFWGCIKQKTVGENNTLFAIEGTSSYGETLTQFLIQSGADVCEVKPPKTRSRAGRGKSDLIDAEMGARNVLYTPCDKLIRPRLGDERKILRVLLSARNILIKQQVMEKNALNALLRSSELGVDTRRAINLSMIREIANSRTRSVDAPHEAIARTEARRLASCIINKAAILKVNEQALRENVELLAPGMTSLVGVGPVCAAIVVCAYSHKGRVRNAAAFASLAGTAPIPASSGNVVRHRLNRHGDRTLNHALDVIAMTRMRTDETTQVYVGKRTTLGLSSREIRRTLKRYIARSLFKYLEKL